MNRKLLAVDDRRPITLDERGMVIVQDADLLRLVAGGALKPKPPAPGPPGAPSPSNLLCPNLCPGGGGNVICVPTPRPPPDPN